MSFGGGNEVRYAVILDSAAALQNLNAFKVALQGLTQPTQGFVSTMAGAGQSVADAGAKIKGVGTDVAGAAPGMEKLGSATDTVATSMEGLGTATTDVATNMEGVAPATDAAATAVETLGTNMEAVGPATDAATSSLEGMTTNSDALTSSLDANASTVETFGNNMGAITAPIRDAGDGMQDMVGELGPLASNFAETEGAAKDMIAQTDKIGTTTKKTGAEIAQMAIGVTTTATGIIGLVRNFRDLGETQIAVDKATRRVSTTQEALEKATAKLAVAQNTYGENSKEAAIAQRDVEQAQMASKTAIDIQARSIKNQNDAWLDLATSGITTVLGVAATGISGMRDFGMTIQSNLPRIKGLVEKLSGVEKGAMTTGAALKAVGGAVAAISLPLIAGAAGWQFYNEAVVVNDKAMKRLNVTGKSVIDRLKEGDTAFGTSAAEVADYGKEVEDFRAGPLGSLLGAFYDFTFGAIPGFNEGVKSIGDSFTAAKTPVEAIQTPMDKIKTIWVDWVANLRASGKPLDDVVAAMQGYNLTGKEMSDIIAQGNAQWIAGGGAAKAYGTGVADNAEAIANVKAAAEDWFKTQKVGFSNNQIAIVQWKEFAKTLGVEVPSSADTTVEGIQRMILAAKGLGPPLSAAEKIAFGFTDTLDESKLAFIGNATEVANYEANLLKTNTTVAESTTNTQAQNEAFREQQQQVKATSMIAEDYVTSLEQQNDALVTQAIAQGATTAQIKDFIRVGGESSGMLDTNIHGLVMLTAELDNAQIGTRLLAAEMAPLQEEASENTKKYLELVKAVNMWGDASGKNMAQLEAMQGAHENITKGLEGQKFAYMDTEKTIIDTAIAEGILTTQMTKLYESGENNVVILYELVGAGIDVTKALTNVSLNAELVAQGFYDGTVQAKQFFENLVKNTEQANTFSSGLQNGAKALGIQANMFAFSDSKMQELLTTTYEMTQGLTDLTLEGAKSVEWIHDANIIIPLLTKAQITGTQSANDWAVGMLATEEAAASEKMQLVALAEEMTGLNNLGGLTSDQLKELMTDFDNTGNSAAALANVVRADLEPAFSRLSGVLDAKTWKEAKDAFKELELGDIGKGLQERALKLEKPIMKIREAARQTGDIFSVLVSVGDKMTSKDYSKWVGELADNMENLAGAKGGGEAFDKILASIKKMSPEELKSHAKSMEFLVEAAKSGGGIDAGEWQSFFDMYNTETPKVGSNSVTAANGVNKLTSAWATLVTKGSAAASLLAKAEANFDPKKSRFRPDLTPEPDTSPTPGAPTKVDVDNAPAMKKIDQVVKRIQDIGLATAKFDIDNAPAIKKVDQVVVRIQGLGLATAKFDIDNAPAIKKVDQVVIRIQGLGAATAKFDIDNAPAIKKVDQVVVRIQGLGAATAKFDIDNAPAIKKVDQVVVRIQGLASATAKFDIDNAPAVKKVDQVVIRIQAITGIKADISLENKNAIKSVDVVAKRIGSLTKIQPDISLQNKSAIKAVDVVAKRIDGLSNIKPQINLQNSDAIKSVDVIARRINDLNQTVTVHVKTVGSVKTAQHGMHETLGQDTVIQAHAGERVDIGPQKPGGQMQTWNAVGGGGNVTIENHVHVMDDVIMRKMTASGGKNRYRFGPS